MGGRATSIASGEASPLARLLTEERDPNSKVALRWDSRSNREESFSWAGFVVDVARLRDRLAEEPGGGWVLLTEDAYAFAVGLMALWHSGRYAISPPNRQAGALRSPQTRASGVLTDRPDWFPEGSTLAPLSRFSRKTDDDVEIGREFEVAAKSFETLDDSALAVEFFTSGTTGDEKPVLKELRHLALEVVELGESWDERVEGAVVFTSASHQHLYGMLFGVLWPLCAGHVFQAEHFLHAGELVPRMQEVERSVLASVPTHLNRLVQHAQSPLLRGRCQQIFSSGGPLPEETAHRIAERIGEAPIEIFGSTETGGIAWRRQQPARDAGSGSTLTPSATPTWTPFPSVEVGEDPESGTLRVRSPFVSSGGTGGLNSGAMSSREPASGEAAWLTTGDRVELGAGGGFALLGRTDRVVKIGERRLDLSRMESELRGERWVDEIALTTLRREGDESDGDSTETQERVAAVVVPSERGWALIRESGRRAFREALRTVLAEAWDPVLHPRYWRYVVDLPENSQGKTTQALLRELFREPDWGQLESDRPEILGESKSVDAIERMALVPVDLSCFPGHFPDRFVVPGVLQLTWAMGLAEVLLGRPVGLRQIESMKMVRPLEPGARFRIRVEATSPTRLELLLDFEGETFSKGRVRIAGADE